MVIVAGRFDEKKALALIEDSFGKIPKPSRVLYKTYTREPAQDGERSVTLRRTGDVQKAIVAYHVPAGWHADFAPVDVLSLVLGSSPSGRLYKALVETKKATSVGGFDFQLKEPGVVLFVAEARKDQPIEATSELLIKTVESSKGFTAEEVERAKTELLKSIDQTRNVTERLALQLSEWAAMGDWRLYFIQRDRIRAVTVADVERVKNTYLLASNRTSGVFIPTEKPTRAEIPEAENVEALVKGYKGEAAVAAGEVFDASPANIDKRTVRTIGPGGLKLALLQKKTRAEIVVLSLSMRLGSEKTLMNKDMAGSLVPPMLLRGTKKHTREQIKDTFDRLNAQVNVGGDATRCTVSVEVERKNLAATLELLTEVLRDPNFDAKEFDVLVKAQLASFEDARKQPQAIASNAFAKHLSPWPKGHPLYAMDADEAIAQLQKAKVDASAAFYKTFYGNERVDLAVVGDFDEAVVKTFAQRTFDTWAAKTKWERIKTPFNKVAAVSLKLQADDKANAMFLAGTTLELKDSDPDYPALALGNYIFGGGFLNSRIATRMRQKDGASYGAGTSLRGGVLDANGSFTVYAIHAPQNLQKIELGLKEELERILKDGVTPEELAAAKAGLIESRAVSRSQDAQLAGMLANYSYVDRNFAYDADLEAKIKALDQKAVLAALKKYLSYEALTTVRAGDFAKAAAAAETGPAGQKSAP
jgi:zinc protease